MLDIYFFVKMTRQVLISFHDEPFQQAIIRKSCCVVLLLKFIFKGIQFTTSPRISIKSLFILASYSRVSLLSALRLNGYRLQAPRKRTISTLNKSPFKVSTDRRLPFLGIRGESLYPERSRSQARPKIVVNTDVTVPARERERDKTRETVIVIYRCVSYLLPTARLPAFFPRGHCDMRSFAASNDTQLCTVVFTSDYIIYVCVYVLCRGMRTSRKLCHIKLRGCTFHGEVLFGEKMRKYAFVQLREDVRERKKQDVSRQ